MLSKTKLILLSYFGSLDNIKTAGINDLKNPSYLESKFEAQIEKVTNDTYLKVFQNNLFKTPVMPEDKDSMESTLNLELDNDELTFNTGVRVYENLSGKNSDRFQYVFP